MESKPLVSILMTSYNRENFIEQSIKSVLNSSFQNWELIILDDHSSDNTVQIAKNFEKEDERIRVHVNQKNIGQFSNRNKIVKYARGKYLKYLDSDDLLYPHGLSVLVKYMEKFPEAGYGLCSLNQDEEKIFPFQLNPKNAYERHYIKNKPLFHKAPLSSIIRRKYFIHSGGFPHESVCGDAVMWNQFSQNTPVVLMPQGLVWYRVHQDQEMQKAKDNPEIELEYYNMELYYLKHKHCPLPQSLASIAIRKNIIKQVKYISSKILKGRIILSTKLIVSKFSINSPKFKPRGYDEIYQVQK